MGPESESGFKHTAVRAARRATGMTQAELAEKIGCRQSAVSMYEAGNPHVLKPDRVDKMAEILGLELSALADAEQAETLTSARVLKYCSNDQCLSNRPYKSGNTIAFMPAMVAGESGKKTHCNSCSEVLGDHCPNSTCKAPLVQGAFCPNCGEEYVPHAHPLPPDVDAWIEERRRDARELLPRPADSERAAPRPGSGEG